MTRIYTYKDYIVTHDGRDWHFVHKDYDGALVEVFDPPGDHRCGVATTYMEAMRLIDEFEEDEE